MVLGVYSLRLRVTGVTRTRSVLKSGAWVAVAARLEQSSSSNTYVGAFRNRGNLNTVRLLLVVENLSTR